MKLKITRTTVANAAFFGFLALAYFIGHYAQILAVWFIGGWVVYFWGEDGKIKTLLPAMLLFFLANGFWFSRERQDQFLQGKLDEILSLIHRRKFLNGLSNTYLRKDPT